MGRHIWHTRFLKNLLESENLSVLLRSRRKPCWASSSLGSPISQHLFSGLLAYTFPEKRREMPRVVVALLSAGPDLPIGYIGLSLGPQDPRGPPGNCGTLRINCRYIISSTIIRQKFMTYYSWNLVFFAYSDVMLITQGSSTNFHESTTNFHESQYDCLSSCMPTIVSIHSMHIGCVLYLLNRTDCYVWITRKNLQLFVCEMHLIKA